MNRHLILLSQTVLTLVACVPSISFAADGDVSFRAADKLINLDPGNLTTAIDVFFEVEGSANVPAAGWGMIVNIAPQPGAIGTVEFNPPTIVNDEPNLLPASQSPFIDFDRDFGGKSYGMLGATATQLNAFTHYIEPTLGPAPALDTNGNVSLPDGSGLVSFPLVMSADAAGDFRLTFDPDPVFTGVIFATGMPAPNDIGIQPVGTHVAGVLSVVISAGDYNDDGVVDAADYVVWRKADGTQPGYDNWRTNFGATAAAGSSVHQSTGVPEPATAALALMALCTLALRRQQSA